MLAIMLLSVGAAICSPGLPSIGIKCTGAHTRKNRIQALQFRVNSRAIELDPHITVLFEIIYDDVLFVSPYDVLNFRCEIYDY